MTETSPRQFETSHTGTFHGTKIAYRCIAGETHLPGPDEKPRVSLFSFSYLADAGDASARPVTFVFNGGPGSASLWLHMGAIGPRIVKVPGDAQPTGPGPYTVIDNALCNLDLTDLVFIDPPGTGFSTVLGETKYADVWGLEQDADVVAQFIKAWLTAHHRWASPRYLCGESYGTTRAVAVAGKLAGNLAGVSFNGIALISTILDFHAARFERGNLLPDACYLTTYAATAFYHGRAVTSLKLPDFLNEVRDFAANRYLPALFAGSRLDPAHHTEIRDRLAQYTGLSPDWLDRTRLRIDPPRFSRKLLRDNPGLRVLVANGLYDLATPFGAVESTLAGNGIPPGRLRMTYYEAGHMMYLHDPSLAALVADLRQLIEP